ncbi:hypothetical protein D3C71_1628750 [compost metagenome]
MATLLAFGQGELAKEVFVDMAEDIFALQVQNLPVVAGLAEVGVGEVGDQVGQLVALNFGARELLVEHVLKLGILALHGLHGVVDQPADGAHLVRHHLQLTRLVAYVAAVAIALRHLPRQLAARWQLGQVTQGLPARLEGHPEDVLLGVVVPHLQLGGDIGLVVFREVRRIHVVVMAGIAELGF